MQSVTIEWRHLVEEGDTCKRCAETGGAIERVVREMNLECTEQECEITLVDTPLTARSIVQSNSILINDIPLEEILPGATVSSNNCESCCELIGESVDCRTIELKGISYDSIPEKLIRDAVCRLANCC